MSFGLDASHDEQLTSLAHELARKWPDLSEDLVLRIVRESYASLARTASVSQHLVPLAERFAKQRLADIVRHHTHTGTPQVLFLCVANAGRSQLAAALTNHLSGGTVIARSAGSTPAPELHPGVQRMITDIEGASQAAERFPKPLTDDAVRAADVVITMGCGDVCPVLPGVRYEDWDVQDPDGVSGGDLEAIREDITTRVRALLDSLSQK